MGKGLSQRARELQGEEPSVGGNEQGQGCLGLEMGTRGWGAAAQALTHGKEMREGPGGQTPRPRLFIRSGASHELESLWPLVGQEQ